MKRDWLVLASALCVGALFGGGCDSGSKKSGSAGDGDDSGEVAEPKKDAPPLEFETTDKGFHIKGKPTQKGETHIFGRIYQVTLRKFPKGTKWSAGDKKGTIDSDIYASIKLKDVSTEMGKANLNELREATVDPDLTLTLTLPSGSTGKVKLPPEKIGFAIGELFKKVENGAVLFGTEPEDDTKKDSIMFGAGFSPKLFGQVSTVNQLDAVAVATQLADVKGTKKCTGYTSKGKAMPDLELQFKETEVTIYARRTGDVRAKKVFPPNKKCPMFTFRKAGENTSDSSQPTAAIEAWLRTQAKR